MNPWKSGVVLACAAFAFTAVQLTSAQAGAFSTGGPMSGVGPQWQWHGFGTPQTGMPYSATRTTTHVQTLANGTTISHESTEQEARDSQGRTYVAVTTKRGDKSVVFYRVFDPVSRLEMSWSSNSKQLTEVHLPEPGQFGPVRLKRDDGTEGPNRPTSFRRGAITPSIEQLGSKVIDGVSAEGTKTTLVILAGEEGNSEPLTVTHENWFAADLKLSVLRIDTDPRSGTTTSELTNIDRNEPNAGLFKAPEGYTVQEREKGQFAARR
jgi:hypothetical protein